MSTATKIIDTTETCFARTEIAWADGILSKPEYTMPNGRSSHEVAREVADKAQNRLYDPDNMRICVG